MAMKKSFMLLLAAALLFLIGCPSGCQGTADSSGGQIAGATAESAGEPTAVLIFGDSNTFGYMPVAFETEEMEMRAAPGKAGSAADALTRDMQGRDASDPGRTERYLRIYG